MRKLYILRDQEDDGTLLDALEACSLALEDLVNPRCPDCGAETYLAYLGGEDFTVLTWSSLDPDDEEAAESWYLVCGEPACDYEEQVERALAPAGAEFFDLEQSEKDLDEFLGYRAAGLRSQIEFLQQVEQEYPNRKLDSLKDAAEWRYKAAMKRTRAWLGKLPTAKRIEFSVEGEHFNGTFLAATGEGLLVRTQPGGELVAVPTEAISAYGPQYFDPNKADPPEPPEPPDAPRKGIRKIDSDRLIWGLGPGEYVVVRGHHLQLAWAEERFGAYQVSCADEAVARELGLTQTADHHWERWFRRHEIDARYDVTRLIKVRGHWVLKYGETGGKPRPAIQTEDPAVAAALGLEPVRAWRTDDRPEAELPIIHYCGIVSPDEVEDQREVRHYHWPLPEGEPVGPGRGDA